MTLWSLNFVSHSKPAPAIKRAHPVKWTYTDGLWAALRAVENDTDRRKNALAHYTYAARLGECLVGVPIPFGTLTDTWDRLDLWLTDNHRALVAAIDTFSDFGEVTVSLDAPEPPKAHEPKHYLAHQKVLQEQLTLQNNDLLALKADLVEALPAHLFSHMRGGTLHQRTQHMDLLVPKTMCRLVVDQLSGWISDHAQKGRISGPFVPFGFVARHWPQLSSGAKPC